MLQTGQIIQNRYRIEQLLGQGGMGMVYLATDQRLGEGHQVAIKELNPAGIPPAERATAIAMFEQEATLLARLNHPSVTRVSDFFDERGYWYLVMEYVAGESLESALERAPAGYGEQQCLGWAEQLLRVLDYLHQQNPPLIFRDLKPQNIMVRPDGKLKLIDFGIARFFKPNQQLDTIQLGTPGYAPPEQYGRHQTDARSDIYSLGVLLYQLLTGYDPTHTPFRMPPIQQLNPAISNGTAAAIHKAMAADPSQRHQTARDFGRALNLPISGEISSPPPTDPGRIPLWMLVLAVLSGLLFLGGMAMLAGRVVAIRATAIWQSSQTPVVVVVVITPTPPPPSPTSPSPTPMPSPTASPTPLPTPSPSPTLLPTPLPSPTVIVIVLPSPVPTSCSRPVDSQFNSTWQANPTLGCPTAGRISTNMAQENFARGRMFWRQDDDRIYAVYSNGVWADYADIWVEGQPHYSCGTAQTPPTPGRGFGKIWCAQSSVQQGLGDATTLEWATSGVIQHYANGMIWKVSGSSTIVFFSNRTWR